MQPGMTLRGRQLPRAVPVVRPRLQSRIPEDELATPQDTGSAGNANTTPNFLNSSFRSMVRFFSGIRRDFSDAFSLDAGTGQRNQPHHRNILMDETLAQPSQIHLMPTTSTPASGTVEYTPFRPRPGIGGDNLGNQSDLRQTIPMSVPVNINTPEFEQPQVPPSDRNRERTPLPSREEYDRLLRLTGLSPVAEGNDQIADVESPLLVHEPVAEQVMIDQRLEGQQCLPQLSGLPPVTGQHLTQVSQHPRRVDEPPCPNQSTELLPAADQPTIVNNYSNCSFGSAMPKTDRRTPKVPLYDDTKLDIESYLANFQAMTIGWSSEEKLALLRAKLTGKAAKILAALDLSGSEVTFETLVAELEHHYVGERSEWVARLRDVRREDGESLDELAFRIRLYSKRAYGCLQKDLGLQLYLALRDGPLGDKLFEVKDKDMTEVLQRAKSYEAHLLAINQPTISQDVASAGHFPPPSAASLRPNHDTSRGRGTGFRGRGQQRYGSRDRRLSDQERRCFLCRSQDHMWRECPRAAAHFSSGGPTNEADNLNP